MCRQFILAGHSHATALGVPNISPSQPFSPVPIEETGGRIHALSAPVTRPLTYWDAVVDNAEGNTILLVWNGNQHLAKFLFEVGRPFDFYMASRPDDDASAGQLVPEQQVREILDRGNLLLKPLLKRLSKVPGNKTILLGTPPPKGDDKLLRELVAKEVFFAEMAERLGVDLGAIPFTHRMVRLKLWMVVQELLSEAAEAEQFTFLPVPEAVRTSEGFLEQHLWREDATHANPAYGRVFWDAMLSEVLSA